MGLTFPIGLDGGVNSETVADAVAAGVDCLRHLAGDDSLRPSQPSRLARRKVEHPVAATIRHLRRLADRPALDRPSSSTTAGASRSSQAEAST